MLTTPPSEYIYQISEQEQFELLQDHYITIYEEVLPSHGLCETSISIPTAGVTRYMTGINYPFTSAVFGYPDDLSDFDAIIEQQIAFFEKAGIPFVWYLDESVNAQIKNKLIKHGFKDIGIFRGVMGELNSSLLSSELPEGCTLNQVLNEPDISDFCDLVCDIFNYLPGLPREMYRKAMFADSQESDYSLYHWIARKDGKAVAAVTTFIKGGLVSFWNGATLPEFRKQGYSTALRSLALKHAISKGCHFGSSYLMAEGLAYGICKKLGYETKWRFHAFVSPSS